MGGSFLTAEASDLMQRGIALLAADTPEGLSVSLACFDAAIGLRRRLFTPGDHGAAYLLAASWMNRGDALSRLGGEVRLAEAIRSYNEVLDVLRDAPPDADPLYRRRRHAIAWMNRGLTLQAQGTGVAAVAAVESLARAVAVTRGWPEHALLLTGVLVNHAKALLIVQPPRAAEARASAVHALENVAEIEMQSPPAAEIHLKAQILLCRAAETSLTTNPDSDESRELLSVGASRRRWRSGSARRRNSTSAIGTSTRTTRRISASPESPRRTSRSRLTATCPRR